MKISVKIKLMALLLTTSIVPIMVLGGFAYVQSYKALSQAAVEELRIKVKGITDTEQTAVEDTNELLRNLATTPSIVRLLNDYNRNGRVTDSQSLVETFKYLRKIYVDVQGIYANMLVVNKDGIVVADSWNGEYTGLSLKDQGYFQRATREKSFAIGGVELAKDSSKTRVKLPSISMAYPVKEITGQVAGAIIITYDFSYFSRHVYKRKFGQSGFGIILDSNGLVLYHPDSSKVLKHTGEPILRGILEKIQRDKSKFEGVHKVKVGNEPYLVVYRLVAKPKWIIAVFIPEREYLAAANNIRSSTLLIILASTFLSLLVGYLAVARLIKSLNQIVQLIKRVEKGDFSLRSAIETRDEFSDLGTSYNHMIEEQNRVLHKLSTTAGKIEKISAMLNKAVRRSNSDMEEISETTRQVSAAAEVNNSGISDVTVVMEQIVQEIRSIRDSSEQAVKNSATTIQIATEGEQSVEDAVKSMVAIEKTTQVMTLSVSELFETIEQALSFVKIIETLAKQTHLLALNAAIEAARAGENGKTFSVVARDVKALAYQSGKAANEINSIISNVKLKEAELLQNAHSVTDSVNTGMQLAHRTVSSLQKIIQAVHINDQLTSNILSSVEEQFASIENIAQAVNKIAEMTGETSRGANDIAMSTQNQTTILQEVNSTSDELAKLAQELYSMVIQFKLLEEPEITQRELMSGEQVIISQHA
ncbi:MAG: methyl-accepting chemotaxis protein [Clostridia bacterium]|nr:methyl-accepting chemotaxis protein [Clostridia bacterium]